MSSARVWLARLPMGGLVLAWIVTGTVLPAVSGSIRGVRDPASSLIHDEHCYLLQADTFARGRLTNPPPPYPEFFESPYLLMEPGYQAKYPPGQAVFLAAGQRCLGQPIYGVWLSCGLFAGTLFWMLAGWSNRHWAMLGTLYAVTVLGIDHYWAQTYWGGMVAAWGGALVFGGARWTIRRRQPRWSDGLLTGLGVVCLANSRPYEGGVLCLACVPVFLSWLLRGSLEERRRKLVRWCVPFVAVLMAGGTAMAVYNQAVTGNWRSPPYVLHPRQTFTCGMFRWQPIDQIPVHRAVGRTRQVYEEWPMLNPGRPDGPALGMLSAVYAFIEAFLKVPQESLVLMNFAPRPDGTGVPWRMFWFLCWIVVILSFLGMSAWSLYTVRRRGLLHAGWGLLLIELAAGALVWWSFPHYRAPVACVEYFLIVDWLRRLSHFGLGRCWPRFIRPPQTVLIVSVLICCLFLPSRFQGAGPAPATAARPENADSPAAVPSVPLMRAPLLAWLAQQPRPVLAFVSYDPAVSLHTEWVYNSADINSQRVILAHDLGTRTNPLLVAAFPERDHWQVRVTPLGAMLQRLPEARQAR